MPRSEFRLFDYVSFHQYVMQTHFRRPIKVLQNHHTWRPGYAQFQGTNHIGLMESMRTSHITDRGWQDIGQNLTIFPDGQIGLCRAIDVKPAGIFGANEGALCMEHLGNFDEGGDVMTQAQQDAIVCCNALLCVKFGLLPQPEQVVYHHWFDRQGSRFPGTEVDSGLVLRQQKQKTCPGTNFFSQPADTFKGNTIKSAETNFYPLIRAQITRLQNGAPTATPSVRFRVNASKLNVRAGSGVAFPVVSQLGFGVLVDEYERSGEWSRISANAEEWVNNRFLI